MRLRARSVLATCALVATLVFAAVPGAAQAPADPAPADDGTWIVVLRPGARAEEVATPLATAHGGTAQHVYRAALNGFSFAGSAQAAAALARNPNVESVTPTAEVELVADGVPVGISRIGGYDTLIDSQRGTTLSSPHVPVRVGVLDSGIDTDHPELQPFVQARSCAPGSPTVEDVIGHGTHVTGTIAARVNGSGITGLAPEVEIVPVKVVEDATASGTDADVICGIDHLLELKRADGRPTVINMSLGEYGTVGSSCDASPLRRAICTATAEGITVVAAAGNDARDIGANPFVPAAFPEVIAASAYVDGDGQGGGLAGCHLSWELLMNVCDDTLAAFSNRGAPVDVTAPGVEVYSTVPGGYGSKSGTSMASPHVAASAALVVAANTGLAPAQVREVLRATGECPDGFEADSAGSCAGHGNWANDTDGIAEPLVRVERATARAASMAGPDTTPPTVSITAPASGAFVRSPVTVTAAAGDDVGVASVQFLADGAPIGSADTSAPYSASWSPTAGGHTLTAVARDAAGNETTSASVAVTVDDTAPTVSLAAPADGATVSGAAVVVSATAGDTGSGVARVDFLVDGAVVGSDTTGPSYETSWNTTTATNGTHRITAVAHDVAGNSATSAERVVTVDNGVATITMRITDMTGYKQVQWLSRSWYVWADATVRDQFERPVQGATVTFRFTSGSTATRTCTTNASGWCSTEANKVALAKNQKSVTITIVDVAKAGAVWDGVRWGGTLTR